MEVLIIIDGNGNFDLSDITDRTKTMDMLKKIGDGDEWTNVELIEGEVDEEHYLTCDFIIWKEFILQFTQRGVAQIKKINF